MILEGSELKLLDDLIDLPIKFIQIELINYNSVEQNVNFFNFNEYNQENLVDIIKNLKEDLKNIIN